MVASKEGIFTTRKRQKIVRNFRSGGALGLWRIMRPLQIASMDLVGASFTLNILSLALPITLLQVYDRILPNEATGTLTLLIAGVGVALVLEAFLRLGRTTITSWAGSRFEHAMGLSAVETMLHSKMTDFAKDGAGVQLERLNSLTTLRDYYSGQAVLSIADMPFVVIFLLLIGWLAGPLVLVPLVLLVLFSMAALWVGRKLHQSLKKRSVDDERRFNFIIEVLTGVHTIKGIGMETLMVRRYERLQENCALAEHGVARWSADAMNIGTLFSQLTMIGVAAYGSTIVIDGGLTIGGLAACTILAGRTMQPIQRALGIWSRLQAIRISEDRIQDLFSMESECHDDQVEFERIEGRIDFHDVGYGEGDNQILKHVAFSMKPGETVAIRGEAGSGKSKLLQLILGSIEATSGEICIDGHPVGDIEPMNLRRHIAYLPQQGVVFHGTILENLTMFRPELEQSALDAAKLLQLDMVAARLPQGFDTRIGDGAHDSLPSGVKQRLAIARALVDRPSILLFDSATMGLDGVGDRAVRSLLKRLKGRVTMIIVTMRPSLAQLADTHYSLQNGYLIPVEAPTFGGPPKPATPETPDTAPATPAMPNAGAAE